eukprot:TRINITY_DN3525_c0_g2_i2.p1 TRINITY_DN3525_c0_g2~~TRINITY_DN3525_c0_g2_i2.p1  ORF type:complete len:364 (+),score=68.95 TRINITY_DN3525_c0_g2_i2:166-1257(+)
MVRKVFFHYCSLARAAPSSAPAARALCMSPASLAAAPAGKMPGATSSPRTSQPRASKGRRRAGSTTPRSSGLGCSAAVPTRARRPWPPRRLDQGPGRCLSKSQKQQRRSIKAFIRAVTLQLWVGEMSTRPEARSTRGQMSCMPSLSPVQALSLRQRSQPIQAENWYSLSLTSSVSCPASAAPSSAAEASLSLLLFLRGLPVTARTMAMAFSFPCSRGPSVLPVGLAAQALSAGALPLVLQTASLGRPRRFGGPPGLGRGLGFLGQGLGQAAKGHLAVLVLGAALGGLHHDAGGQVGQAHPGLGLVAVLPAGPGGPEELPEKVGLFYARRQFHGQLRPWRAVCRTRCRRRPNGYGWTRSSRCPR